MSALSDYLENRVLDAVFRGQALPTLTTMYVGLFTATPSDTGGGTEVTGGSYARVAVTSSLANWAGTQAAASTVASSGTGGTTSNNATITFPTPTAGWGSVVGIGVFDASTSGNLLWYSTLTVSKTINTGDIVDFPAASLTFQIDN
jgi:hypothetical protein